LTFHTIFFPPPYTIPSKASPFEVVPRIRIRSRAASSE
jgi:hypothetical protein